MPYIASIAALIGLFITIESRQERRSKKQMDAIEEMIDTKIEKYANRIQSEKLTDLLKENERLKEYARDKK